MEHALEYLGPGDRLGDDGKGKNVCPGDDGEMSDAIDLHLSIDLDW
jgi:hypothetical protein